MLVTNTSQFKENLDFYINNVADKNDTVIVHGNGKSVVMITLDKYEEHNKIDETEYLLGSQANKEMLERSIAQSKEREFISKTMDELEAMENEPLTGRISIEQYNKEIDEAEARIEAGEYYTQEQVDKIMSLKKE